MYQLGYAGSAHVEEDTAPKMRALLIEKLRHKY
jgi:hypothetical protein